MNGIIGLLTTPTFVYAQGEQVTQELRSVHYCIVGCARPGLAAGWDGLYGGYYLVGINRCGSPWCYF